MYSPPLYAGMSFAEVKAAVIATRRAPSASTCESILRILWPFPEWWRRVAAHADAVVEGQVAGLEGAMFLRYNWLAVKLLGLACVLNLPILLPCYMLPPNSAPSAEFARNSTVTTAVQVAQNSFTEGIIYSMTISNLPDEDHRLYVSVAVCIVFTFAYLAMLGLEWRWAQLDSEHAPAHRCLAPSALSPVLSAQCPQPSALRLPPRDA